eukprot:1020769-Pyramimonas_sp.AAC.1
MQYWLGRGWTEHRIRRWYYPRNVERSEEGKIARSKRTGPGKTPEKSVKRDLKRAVIEERKRYRGVCCTCPNCADHGPGCPMRHPSRSPSGR